MLGPKTVNYYAFFVETITHSTDMMATKDINLFEEGLSLWLSMLRFVPYSSVLTGLFPGIPTVLEFTGEEEYMLRRQLLRVIEAYVLLSLSLCAFSQFILDTYLWEGQSFSQHTCQR